MSMDVLYFYQYAHAMEVIEAQETLRSINVSTYPHLKPDARRRVAEGLRKTANRFNSEPSQKGKALSPKEILSIVNGM